MPAEWVTLSFGVMVQADALAGSTIVNTATLDALNDDAPPFTRTVGVKMGGLFLPLVLRNYNL
jgi:hypothetical protein